MILLVTGGRDYADVATLESVLDDVRLTARDGSFVLINGGCEGADQLSTLWAKNRGLGGSVIEVPVAKNTLDAERRGCKFDWESQGLSAGPLRNQFMLDTYKPTYAVVFPGDKGTRDMLNRLFTVGVPTWLVGRQR